MDGRIVVLPPASNRHQDLVRFFLTLLNQHVEEHSLGWLCCAPFVMYLAERPQGREPDLLFVKHEREHLVEENCLRGPADLVIEIVSPFSIARDRGEKFVEYEAGGVSEYWLIDPQRRQAVPEGDASPSVSGQVASERAARRSQLCGSSL